MNSNVIDLQNYQFNDLNKYLRAIYVRLETSGDLSSNEKKIIAKKSIGEFYKRARVHRGHSITEVAQKLKIEPNVLKNFEDGLSEFSKDLFFDLHRLYKIHHQVDNLHTSFDEFKNPGTFKSRRDYAIDIIKKTGLIPNGVNLKELKIKRGQVIEGFWSKKTDL